MADVEIEFVDELPKVQRGTRESGVWGERLAPLRDHPMQWARVFGPTKNPHATIANVQNGNAAGLPDADWFEFTGRNIPTGNTVEDKDGNEVAEKEGYVFARFMDPERKEERDAELEAKRAARAEREANAA